MSQYTGSADLLRQGLKELATAGNFKSDQVNSVPVYNGTDVEFRKLPSTAVETASSSLVPGSVTISAAAEASHARAVTCTVNDIAGTAFATNVKATVWVSSTAKGVPAATPPSSTTTFGTGTVLKITTADVLFDVVSSAAGAIVLTITEATAKSFYVNVAVGGVVTSSSAIAFAG